MEIFTQLFGDLLAFVYHCFDRTFRVRAPPSPRNRVIAALRVKDLDQPGKIGERPGQPVDLVDDHDVDPVSPDNR